jgi:hypothetical protein
MKDDLRQLEAQLEQATAPGFLLGENLPPDTASLRSGWLALGSLLDAAQEETPLPLSELPPSPVRRSNRALPLVLAALAASLLVTVTILAHLRGEKPLPASFSQPSGIVRNSASPNSNKAAVAIAEQKQTEIDRPFFANEELAWNDSLDDEVESARQAFRHSQQEDFVLASASSEVQYQLETLQIEIDESSL